MVASAGYGADRSRRLRTLMWVAVAVAVLLAALGLWALPALGDEQGAGTFLTVSLVAAGLLAAAAVATMRALDAGRASARRGAVATGVLLIVLGLGGLGWWVGLLLPLLGLATLFLALVPDEPEPTGRERSR